MAERTVALLGTLLAPLRRRLFRLLDGLTVALVGLAGGPRAVNSGLVEHVCGAMCHLQLVLADREARRAWTARNRELLDPFVDNPDSPVKVADIERADLILAADGHRDEVGSTVEIAQKTGARTLTAFELGTWLTEQGVPAAQVVRSNPGGRLRMDGITVRLVGSVHGSGLPAPTATTPYGGPAVGFFITFENGWTAYFAGSTGMTGDQALWARMYRPDLVILPMDGSREPMDFAMMVRLLQTDNRRLSWVFPHHHRVTPTPGQTTIEEVQAAMDELRLDMKLTRPELNQVYTFP